MKLTVAGTSHREPTPLRPMSWLDWAQDDEEYVGGDYRIRLIGPGRWQVLHRGSHLAYDPSLQSAFSVAEHHHRELLRRRDLMVWGGVLLASILVSGLVEMISRTLDIWAVPVLAIALYAGVSAVVRMYAAATRNRFDPYRRRAPWEPRAWWQQ
jgi:hypothetical protein